MVVLMMVTAAAIPIMAPALENRRMREAARLASTFISGARAKAIQRGREVGVVIQRFEGAPYAMTLSYVEVPPPYGGEVAGATCVVSRLTAPPNPTYNKVPAGMQGLRWYGVTFPSGAANYQMFRIGDTIRFNYQGPLYTILGPDSGDGTCIKDQPIHVTDLSAHPVSIVTYPFETATTSFSITRQPMRTSDQPLTLPDGIVIDLLCSGQSLSPNGLFVSTVPGAIPARPPRWPVGWSGSWATNPPAPYDPVITFTPSGSVGHIYAPQGQRAIGPIFLMLGRRELMPDVAQLKNAAYPNTVEDKNIFDEDTTPANLYLQNFWLTIGNQTGLVTTSEVARNQGPMADPTNYLLNARSIAITSQSVGGR
jgi:hypothetical protein